MRRINLDLFELQAFVRLAEHGSFRAAAENVGLSGSALSRLIARIEEKLDARLFDRDTRNVELTPQGHRLLELSGRILAETEAALDEFDVFLAARRGQLTLAGLPSVTAGLLPPIIARFAADRPDVDVRIFDALSDGVVAALLDRRADLGFTAGAVTASERLAFRPLFDEPFMAVAWPGGPLDEPRTYTWAELVGMPFIAMSPGTSVRALIESAVAQQGLSLRPRFEVSHLATAGALVAEALGVTALPSLTLPVLGGSQLVVRPLEKPIMVRRIGLVYLAGRTPSPSASAFRDLLLSTDFRRLISTVKTKQS
ncbi:LysR family transcriptional regulator [Roseinatronobacter alkalisoli]|uniref:LysR family transcriptional regulator n=1 Tax=Roseinatronobacter alkalisoli TaxID=3028235 RepID=A0ABT5T7B5_9RHOB|nr:LysR family transcriptional regulator [Roseinatronobacter sp. HJB301]MDD7971020.1 LysR family transcriptional regulator [Roseinatronobacter sp. HJB301]